MTSEVLARPATSKWDYKIAREETRRQTKHDSIVAATTVVTHPVVLVLATYVIVETGLSRGWFEKGPFRFRADAVEAAVAAAALAPYIVPAFSSVVKALP